ncbi:MAG: c-type cytochrome [Gammaproteobacteria bacterium]|nr:c-type cytochrome [Gammaproteobacteria bacterium]MBU1653755.1 c-type cytochrome [Gammaproteobacteria bacterium]MBU1962538.1 c-type cytochrome [Gammaproteobacteria bacterium]
MMKRPVVALLCLTGLIGLPFANAAGPEILAREKCGNCHGDEGVSRNDRVPSIAGFSAQTISGMLEAYASGDRRGVRHKPEGGEETDMGEVVKALTDEDKKALAGFFSQQKFRAHPQDANAALAAEGARIHEEKCEKCHSDGGTNANDDAAILGGQWRAYLGKGFKQLTTGERTMPEKMRKRFEKLSKDQKTQLIEYYVSGGGKR